MSKSSYWKRRFLEAKLRGENPKATDKEINDLVTKQMKGRGSRTGEPIATWTDEEKGLLEIWIAENPNTYPGQHTLVPELAGLFPNRTNGAVYSKIRAMRVKAGLPTVNDPVKKLRLREKLPGQTELPFKREKIDLEPKAPEPPEQKEIKSTAAAFVDALEAFKKALLGVPAPTIPADSEVGKLRAELAEVKSDLESKNKRLKKLEMLEELLKDGSNG